jgi:hypothetical protein
MSSHESWLDAQIRQAEERGDFDNLPGLGKPLPDRGELYDEDWWIKQWVRREEIAGVVPTSLKVKKEAEELMTELVRQTSEAAVRRIVRDLNQRIDRVQRGHVDGPPVIIDQFDVDAVVEEWRRRRAADSRHRPGSPRHT